MSMFSDFEEPDQINLFISLYLFGLYDFLHFAFFTKTLFQLSELIELMKELIH